MKVVVVVGEGSGMRCLDRVGGKEWGRRGVGEEGLDRVEDNECLELWGRQGVGGEEGRRGRGEEGGEGSS